MKCPYRMNEMHTCHDGKTWIYREFAECYGKPCPYFGVDEKRRLVSDNYDRNRVLCLSGEH